MSGNSTLSNESVNMNCFTSSPSSLIYISYNITYIVLLLPLSIFILYHRLQQWRSSSSAVTMSHSDSFTYHMVTMELTGICGCIVSCFGTYKKNLDTLSVAGIFMSFAWYGKIFFHTLTCVERYLAVVHPITYMSLRKERGIRIRNISIGCVWLVSFVRIGFVSVEHFIFVILFLLIFSLAVISFCSLSVLWVLIRPGPGDQVGRRERVDQSKLRAFYTIMIILGVLVLKSAWDVVWVVVYVWGETINCVIMACEVWFDLPCSLVLPLLFLHRKYNTR